MPKVVTQLWNERHNFYVPDFWRQISKHHFQTTTQLLLQRHTRTHNDNQVSCQEVIGNTSSPNLELIIAQTPRETVGMMNNADTSE